jgi:hypothetical protein
LNPYGLPQRVLYGGLHGNPELASLLAKLKGHPFQDLRKFLQDLSKDMLAGG